MSSDRPGEIASDLYLNRGANDADHRCEVNLQLGDFDLGGALLDVLNLLPGETLIDVGCGSGRLLERFAERLQPGGLAQGFDISEEAVWATRKRELEADVADAADLPVTNAFADALTCIFAIYYHDDLVQVLSEFSRVLKKGGRIAIAGPARETNRELYEFHRRATGAEPSDADTMALGYVEEIVKPAIQAEGFDHIQFSNQTNRIVFPDSRRFLDYWTATSLFARTPGASLDKGRRVLASHEGPVVVTKVVSILAAIRS